MEVQIKKAIKAGNSSAVVLPRSWLNKEVRVELLKKTPEVILLDVLEVLKNHINQEDIIGIYLTGSHARKEEDNTSDIDIVVLTNNTDINIKEGAYSILAVSKKLLEQKLENDILPIGPMLKEAKPLLNSSYIKEVEVKATKKNTNWYIETTQEKVDIIDKSLNEYKAQNKKNIVDHLAYTIVLRIRTLEIIKKLIENSSYSKKDFIRLLRKVSGSQNAYKSYLIIKNSLKEKQGTTVDEAENLYKYLKKQLELVKTKLE